MAVVAHTTLETTTARAANKILCKYKLTRGAPRTGSLQTTTTTGRRRTLCARRRRETRAAVCVGESIIRTTGRKSIRRAAAPAAGTRTDKASAPFVGTVALIGSFGFRANIAYYCCFHTYIVTVTESRPSGRNGENRDYEWAILITLCFRAKVAWVILFDRFKRFYNNGLINNRSKSAISAIIKMSLFMLRKTRSNLNSAASWISISKKNDNIRICLFIPNSTF